MTTTVPRLKPRREDLPADANLCDHCTAKCCRYFALQLDKPTVKRDFDYIRWFLLHQRAAVFVEEGDWYLLIYTTCRHLQSDNRCGIYETRPQICREYTTDNCEYDDMWTYEQYFERPEQFVEYCEAINMPRRGKKEIRGPKPVGLPMI